jgi:hypothetical protein
MALLKGMYEFLIGVRFNAMIVLRNLPHRAPELNASYIACLHLQSRARRPRRAS